ncbi:hypothetical protein VPHD520_0083 [Vibrio phage D520]
MVLNHRVTAFGMVHIAGQIRQAMMYTMRPAKL